MSIQVNGLKAYSNAMANFNKAQKNFEEKADSSAETHSGASESFAATLKDSLKNVNEMQSTKNQMIRAFASGETQNVHELMITLQKAGLAVNLTSAVRNKVLEAYKELSRIQF